jgi:cytochrome c oxidase subunit 5a
MFSMNKTNGGRRSGCSTSTKDEFCRESRDTSSDVATVSPHPLSCRYECFFNREDIDGWDIRQGMNDLLGYDAVPEPPVIIAALQACRRMNDYAMTVRFLEAVKNKCGNQVNQIYPYIVQEIAPTLCELGCDLPETLCYHKPELFLKSVFEY